jgi:TRAP-type C4-dicarboxylate transport system permease small subunit
MEHQAGQRTEIRLFLTLFRILVKVSSGLGMFGIVLMLAMISVDICGRVFFNSPLAGVPELVRLMIVCIVFLQLTRTIEVGQLIRSESLINHLRSKIKTGLEVFYNLVGVLAFAVIFICSWEPMIEAWASHEAEASGLISVPVFPVRLIVLVGSGLASVRFMANTVLALSSLLSTSQAAAKDVASHD